MRKIKLVLQMLVAFVLATLAYTIFYEPHQDSVRTTVQQQLSKADAKQSAAFSGFFAQEQELPSGKELRLCLNNYRATGAGGYPLYAGCPVLREEPTEIAQLIMDYVRRHREITVDPTQWLHVLGVSEALPDR